jgi:hypothetical protein
MKNLYLNKILIAVIIIILLYQFFLLYSNDRWTDGDEVHYLVVTSSLLNDVDLILDNNYENKDYFLHHAHEEEPTAYNGKYGELRPPGGILISAILVPAYKISLVTKEFFGFQGNRSFLFFPRLTIFAIHIIFSVILIKFLRSLGINKNISLLSTILFLITLPIVIYSQAIYTDLLSAYFIMMGIYGILLFKNNEKYIWLIMSGSFFGLSIFLHSKTIILTSVIIISSLLFLFSSGHSIKLNNFRAWFNSYSGKFLKTLISLFAPWLLSLLINILMKIYWFGNISFDGVGQKIGNFGLLSIAGNPLTGFLGQWLDIEVGLISNAPLFLFIFAGLFIWFRKNKPTFLLIVPGTLIYLLFNASYYDWHAGFSPSGRYLLIVLPILLPSISYILKGSKNLIWLRCLVFLLSFLSLLITLLIPFVGRRGLPYYDGYNIYWQTILKFLRLESLESYISLNFFDPRMYDYIIGISVFILIFILGFYLQIKIKRIEKAI